MTNQQYQAICNQHPTLTSEGFGVDMTYAGGKTQQQLFEARRRELIGAVREFELCSMWLHMNTIEDGRNAHYWKDQVQRDCRPPDAEYFHIPRGVFILAALSRGFKVRKIPGSTDAWISNPYWNRVALAKGDGRNETK